VPRSLPEIHAGKRLRGLPVLLPPVPIPPVPEAEALVWAERVPAVAAEEVEEEVEEVEEVEATTVCRTNPLWRR